MQESLYFIVASSKEEGATTACERDYTEWCHLIGNINLNASLEAFELFHKVPLKLVQYYVVGCYVKPSTQTLILYKQLHFADLK